MAKKSRKISSRILLLGGKQSGTRGPNSWCTLFSCQLKIELLYRLQRRYGLPVGPRHQHWGFWMVCGMDHVVHNGTAVFPLKNWPCFYRLISKVFFKAKYERISSLFAGHFLQLSPVISAPPHGTHIKIFLCRKC